MAEIILQRYADFEAAPELTTHRLRLRPHVFEDFAALEAMFQSERSRYMGGPLPRKTVWGMFSDSVGQWPLIGMGTWAVEHKSDGVTVGEVGICRPPHYPEPELGWYLIDGFEGRGYATEAAAAALAFAARTYALESLVSYIDPDNQRSIDLALRLGGVRDPDARTPDDGGCLVYRHRLQRE